MIEARLVLENDLLTSEVGGLRVELDEARRAVKRHETSMERLQADIAVGALKSMDPEELRIRLLEARALDDIHWLLNTPHPAVVGTMSGTRPGCAATSRRRSSRPSR